MTAFSLARAPGPRAALRGLRPPSAALPVPLPWPARLGPFFHDTFWHRARTDKRPARGSIEQRRRAAHTLTAQTFRRGWRGHETAVHTRVVDVVEFRRRLRKEPRGRREEDIAPVTARAQERRRPDGFAGGEQVRAAHGRFTIPGAVGLPLIHVQARMTSQFRFFVAVGVLWHEPRGRLEEHLLAVFRYLRNTTPLFKTRGRLWFDHFAPFWRIAGTAGYAYDAPAGAVITVELVVALAARFAFDTLTGEEIVFAVRRRVGRFILTVCPFRNGDERAFSGARVIAIDHRQSLFVDGRAVFGEDQCLRLNPQCFGDAGGHEAQPFSLGSFRVVLVELVLALLFRGLAGRQHSLGVEEDLRAVRGRVVVADRQHFSRMDSLWFRHFNRFTAVRTHIQTSRQFTALFSPFARVAIGARKEDL